MLSPNVLTAGKSCFNLAWFVLVRGKKLKTVNFSIIFSSSLHNIMMDFVACSFSCHRKEAVLLHNLWTFWTVKNILVIRSCVTAQASSSRSVSQDPDVASDTNFLNACIIWYWSLKGWALRSEPGSGPHCAGHSVTDSFLSPLQNAPSSIT